MTSGEGLDKVYGGNIHFTWSGTELETLPAISGGWDLFKKGDKTSPNFDDPRLIKNLTMWYEMQNVHKSVISLPVLKAEQISTRMPFAEGRAAMLLSNWWSLAWFKNARFGSAEGNKLMQFNLDLVNIPRWDRSTPTNLNATDLNYYYAVPKTAKNPREGALFARFTITDMMHKLGALSSYRHVDVDEFKAVFNKYIAEDGTEYDAGYSSEIIEKILARDIIPISAYYKIDKGFYPEGSAVLNIVYEQERELLYSDQQTLEETISHLQEREKDELKKLQ